MANGLQGHKPFAIAARHQLRIQRGRGDIVAHSWGIQAAWEHHMPVPPKRSGPGEWRGPLCHVVFCPASPNSTPIFTGIHVSTADVTRQQQKSLRASDTISPHTSSAEPQHSKLTDMVGVVGAVDYVCEPQQYRGVLLCRGRHQARTRKALCVKSKYFSPHTRVSVPGEAECACRCQ